MSMTPRLLDLFCGAGGAGEGYRRAGFDVTGVDIALMPNNPHTFIQADALEYLAEHGHEYDAIHASPPCQAYSVTRNIGHGKEYPDLIGPTREALEATGKPYVIENVVGAPLNTTIMLCGAMFGLKVYRHRLFESNVMLFQPPHPKHTEKIGKAGRGPNANGWMSVSGNIVNPDAGRAAMGMDHWMTRNELSQSIPPAYTEYIGRQLMAVLPLFADVALG